MTAEEQAGIAIGNLVGALVSAFHVAQIDKSVSGAMLTMFEQTNAGRLPEGPLRQEIQGAIDRYRLVLNHLPG